MRILILSTVHRWNDPRVFHKEARTLAREHEVILAAVGEGSEEIVDGIRVKRMGSWRTHADRLKLWVAAYREIFKCKPDAIHFHDPELALLLLPLAFLSNKRIVCDIHEDPSTAIAGRNWIPKSIRKITAGFFHFILRYAPLYYDAVILAEESYAKRFPARNNIHLILNYALIPHPDVPFSDRYEHFDPQRELHLIYVGSLTADRGAREMIAMFQRLRDLYPNTTLDLIGQIRPRTLEEELRNRAEESDGGIRVHGYLDFGEAVTSLQRAHIGLIPLQPCPNYVVSIATKFYDYMIYGLPFVASDFPLWEAFIRDNPYGITADSTNPAALADAVISLVKSPKRLQEMSRQGYDHVRKRFNWESQAEKLLNIYRSFEDSDRRQASS